MSNDTSLFPPSGSPAAPVSRRRWPALLVLVLLGFGAWMLWRGVDAFRAAPAGPEAPASLAEALSGPDDAPPRPGPWGELRIQRLTLERPDEFISLPAGDPPVPAWFFVGFTPAQLTQFLARVPLGAAAAQALGNPSAWQVRPDGVIVQPSRELVLGLSREARGALYNQLGRFPQNSAQFHVFKYRRERLAEWLDGSGLSKESRGLFEQYLYDQGASLCFADFFEVAGQLPTQAERRRLLKTLSREPALQVRLRVHGRSDLDALTRYWGRRGRAKDVRPLLEAVARTPAGGEVDVMALLPPFARQRLYAHPFPSEDPRDLQRDCTWSALNFFAETPDDRFGDPATALQAIGTDHYPVKDAPRFGDLVCLFDQDRRLLHTAVYLADRVVFTKNGAYHSQPWLLADFNDVVAHYSTTQGLQVVAYRSRKD